MMTITCIELPPVMGQTQVSAPAGAMIVDVEVDGPVVVVNVLADEADPTPRLLLLAGAGSPLPDGVATGAVHRVAGASTPTWLIDLGPAAS